MKEMSSTQQQLPEILEEKEKLIFGNIQVIYDFHQQTFLGVLEEAKGSLEDIAKCFMDYQTSGFEPYVTYCENKPKSESFLWTFQHSGGAFFEEAQKRLGFRHDISSFLIKPVQRITKYQLLLKDLHKTAQKAGMVCPTLEKALQLMQDVPKRANDAMTLSMINGYEGNIHTNGQLILEDEFTVYEKARWTGAKRHLFLLDQRLVLTKEKDVDGLYIYKDSLKTHNLSIAEKEGDNPCRFAVGTGQIGTWDQYYMLEASSPERKQVWLAAIKEILKHQFEMLKALKQPSKGRSRTFESSELEKLYSPDLPLKSATMQAPSSAALIALSDDSEVESEDDIAPSPRRPRTHAISSGAETALPPATARDYNLYVVLEDCPPPPSKQKEKILHLLKGQVYLVTKESSDWWWYGHLLRPSGSSSFPFPGPESCREAVKQAGWLAPSFLERYTSHLTLEEEALLRGPLCEDHSKSKKKRLSRQSAVVIGSPKSVLKLSHSTTHSISSPHSPLVSNRSPRNSYVGVSKKEKVKITNSFSFQQDVVEGMEGKEGGREEVPGGGGGGGGVEGGWELAELPNSSIDDCGLAFPKSPRSVRPPQRGKAPQITSHLFDETVICGRSVTLRCEIDPRTFPVPTVGWTHNGEPLSIERAFTSDTSAGGDSCVLKVTDVEKSDGGSYACTVRNLHGKVTSFAKLTVLSPPDAPGQPSVKLLTSTSVSLSWDPPGFNGHSPVSIFLVECQDTSAGHWSTLMRRITQPSVVISDLVSGAEYVFRVIAGNSIGSSPPSAISAPVALPQAQGSAKQNEVTFSSGEAFEDHFSLLDEVARGQYSCVYECLHNATQQTYAAKLVPVTLGRGDAEQELEVLNKLSHPHIVRLTSAYLTSEHYITIFQFISGPNLLEYFVGRGSYSESLLASCFRQILNAMSYLHSNHIVHLDIRPENFLTVQVDGRDTPTIKLIHFGKAQELEKGVSVIMHEFGCQFEYQAPEVITGDRITMATDMWSIGVLLYTFLSGTSPFLVESPELTRANIENVRYEFPAKHFRLVTEKAKDLISQLLVKDPRKRVSSDTCLHHPWVTVLPRIEPTPLDPARLKSYLSNRKLQKSLFPENQLSES